MHNDIKDSIKARLYDMKYTPFLASYVFFFVYFNAKLFLIFFDPNMPTECKIEKLSYDMVNKLTPLWWSLGYTLVFPFFQIGFYSAKVWFDKKMNERKQKIEEQTLLSLEESKEIRYATKKLQDELNEYIKKYEQTKKEYDEYKIRLEAEYQSKSKKLESAFEERISRETDKLKNELIEAQKKVADRGGEIEQLKKQLTSLETKVNQTPKYASKSIQEEPKNGLAKMVEESQNKQNEGFQKLIASLEDDEKSILKIIYDNNVSYSPKEQYIQQILKDNTIKRVKVESILQRFENKKIIELSNIGYYDTTEIGKKLILELFDGK